MSLLSAARRLAKQLQSSGHKIVLAESCTGGLASAALTQIPGISAHHCGGMVTYRNQTKADYLGIDPRQLKRPGPVSEKVALRMAQNILALTPEATIGVSVTGHLGPDAPPRLDGLVYIAVVLYDPPQRGARPPLSGVHRLRLSPLQNRLARQRAAAGEVLLRAAEAIAASRSA